MAIDFSQDLPSDVARKDNGPNRLMYIEKIVIERAIQKKILIC
jgi:hypothetical protein